MRLWMLILPQLAETGPRWRASAGILFWISTVNTDTEGHYAVAEIFYRNRRATHLSALDQSLPFTPRSTMWVAAAGLKFTAHHQYSCRVARMESH